MKSYGFYLWPVLVVVIILVGSLNVDLPKINEIKQARQELSGIKEKLAKLTAKTDLLKALDQNKLKADYEKTTLVLPEDKDAPSVLRLMEISASSSGVTVEDLDLNPGKLATGGAISKEKANNIPVKLIVSGSAQQISDFLSKMAAAGRATGLTSLDLSFAKEGSASAKTRLEVEAYFFMPQAVLSKVGKVDEPLSVWGSQEKDSLNKVWQRELLAPSTIITPAGKTDLFK